MAQMRTEALHEHAGRAGYQAAGAVLRFLADAQVEAAGAVRDAIGEIAEAAAIVAERLGQGGRLAYAAAGSSGLMALADALELPGTYGISPRPHRHPDRRRRRCPERSGRRAGGRRRASRGRDVADAGIGAGDCLIAVSASGSTPYALGALEEAARRGAKTIAIANNAGSPLLELAEAPILLATPPELIAGSTRMGAGTAQKIALNMLSTLAAIHLGHVHDGYMVNLYADNLKLRAAPRASSRRSPAATRRRRSPARKDRRLGQAGDPACRGRRRRRGSQGIARRDRPEAPAGLSRLEGSRP